MSISLKIFLVDLGTVKTNQYPTDMYIIDVCKDIRSKFNYGDGGLDHGLLFKSQGLWLAPNKMLGHYDLKFGDLIEFRKKHRILKVKTLDGNVKNILFDESITVKAIVEVISQRIGLANGEEYSLMRDEDAQLDPSSAAAKEKEKKKKDKDAPTENNWLNPDKTLREQGLTEEDFVVLKKKFFVTDQNVDRTDPVQLVIMHAQACKDILSGKLPCTAEEAAQFGGIALQIMYGNQDPTKHKPGFAKMKDLVPPEYIKNKDVEKACYKEHSILQGTTELNAKFRYVQLIRSLKSYGTTFYLVNEPADKSKKKKAQQVLLGITKSAVVRMDVESKKIITEWKLTQLRNWSASPKTFTIDLGDHDTKYYQVETKEGEEIARLLSGYVEIIVKKRNMLNIRPKEQNMEEQAVVEEYVKPGQSRNIAAVTTSTASQAKALATATPGMAQDFSEVGRVKSTKGAIAQDLDEVEDQELLLRLIKGGIDSIDGNLRELQTPMAIPIGSDPAAIQWRQDNATINAENLSSHIGGLLAAVSAMLLHATGDTKSMDYDLMGGSLTTMVAAATNTTQALRVLASLTSSEEDQDDLIQCGKDLIDATMKLLRELQPIVTGHQVLTELHNTASKVALSGTSLLIMTDRIDVNELNQSELIDAAGDVSTALLQLIDMTKTTVESFKNPATKKLVVKNIKSVNEANAALATITAVLAGVITNPFSRDQLIETAAYVNRLVVDVKQFCDQSSDKDAVAQILEAIEAAEQALSFLVEKARNVESTLEAEIQFYKDQIVATAETINETADIPQELFANAKELAILGTRLADVLKTKALQVDSDEEKDDLNQTASIIAELMAQMVSATRETLSNPNNTGAKTQLLDVVEEIRDIVSKQCDPYMKASMVQSIIKAYKATISCSNQVIASGRQAAVHTRDRTKISKLNKAGKAINEKIPSAVKSINDAKFNLYEFAPRLKLIESAKDFITPAQNLIAGVEEAAPSISDNTGKNSLLVASEKLDVELQNLMAILDACSGILSEVDFKSIMDAFKGTKTQDAEVSSNDLLNINAAELILTDHAQALVDTMRKITEAFTNSDPEAQAKAIGVSIAEFQSIKTTLSQLDDSDPSLKNALLKASSDIGDALSKFMEKISKSEIDSPKELRDLSNGAAYSVNELINQLPRQKAMLEAMGTIKKLTEQLEEEQRAKATSPSHLKGLSTDAQVADIQNLLLAAATDLSTATQSLVNGTKKHTAALKAQISAVERNYGKLIQAASAIPSEDGEIGNAVHSIGLETDFFLNALQASLSDRNGTDLSDQLIDSARSVGEVVDSLIGIFASSSRGLDDCTKALQILNATASLVADINAPRKDHYTYSDLQLIAKGYNSQLSGKVKSLLFLLNSKDSNKMSAASLDICNLLQELVARSMDGAHLLSAADPTTIAAVPSKLNQEGILKSIKSIRGAMIRISQPSSTQSSLFDDAILIATQSAALCNICKKACEYDESLKDGFGQLSSEMAKNSSLLVPLIKNYAIARTDSNREQMVASENVLASNLEKVESFAKNPEFSGQNAKPSGKALAIQQPFIECSNSSIQEARSLVVSIQSIIASPDNSSNKSHVSSSASRLCELTARASQLLDESSPASAEFLAALSPLLEGKKEIIFALKRQENGEWLVDNGADISTFNKSIASMVDLVDGLLKSSQVSDLNAILHTLQDLPERFDRISKPAAGIVAQCSPETQKPISQSIKDLSNLLSAYVKSVQAHVADPNEIRLFTLENAAAEIHKAASDVTSKLKESERLDPVFSDATKTVEDNMNKFEALVAQKTVDKEQVALGQASKTLVDTEKQLVALLTEAVTQKNVEEYGRIATETSNLYVLITTEVANISKQTTDTVITDKLTNIVKDLGETTARAVAALKQGTRSGEQETIGRTKVTQAIKELGAVFENLDEVKKEVATGILACEQVTVQVMDIQTELETSLSFAVAKQLNPSSENDNFAIHKDGLLSNAQKLTEIFKTFVNANSLDQETLGTLVTGSAEAMMELKTKAIIAATSLSSADYSTQQELILSTLQVGEAMKSLIDATSTASGCTIGDAVTQLNMLIENQFDVVSQLVDVVKKLDNNEASRNLDAYQNIISSTRATIAVLHSSDPALGTALPDELALLANQLATSVAALVGQIDTTADKLPLLNQIKNDVESLCRAGKAIVANAPPEKASATLGAVSQTCLSTVEVLESIQQCEETGEVAQFKQQIQAKVKSITTAVNLVVSVASKLVPEGYVDPNDPNVVAERELLSAANAIEAAARKLASLRPAEAPREANEELNFEEQILEAAKAIAAASSALVRSATGVQRELVAKGKSGTGEGGMYFSDGTWSDGLVSAAKQVVGATSDLCESANLFVRNEVGMERVIVSAKNVSSSTVQLLTSASVRSDPNSQVQMRLRSAGKAVTLATEQLVTASQNHVPKPADGNAGSEAENITGISPHKAKIKEMEIQMKILRLEKELEEARGQLAALRKQKYNAAATAVVAATTFMSLGSKAGNKKPDPADLYGSKKASDQKAVPSTGRAKKMDPADLYARNKEASGSAAARSSYVPLKGANAASAAPPLSKLKKSVENLNRTARDSNEQLAKGTAPRTINFNNAPVLSRLNQKDQPAEASPTPSSTAAKNLVAK